MNKNPLKLKSRAKWLTLATFGGGLVATLPLIAIACGESDPAPTTPTFDAKSFLESTVATATTASGPTTNVTWTAVPALPTVAAATYNAPEFSTFSFPSETAARDDSTPGRWSTTLPKTFSDTPASRVLWARVANKTSTSLSVVANWTSKLANLTVESADKKEARAYLATVETALVAQPTSVPTAVTWPATPALPTPLTTKYAAVTFSTVAYTDESVALTSADSNWTSTPPATVGAVSASRTLWVRLVGLTASTTATESVALNITDKSGVKNIETADKKSARAYLTSVETALVAASTSVPTAVTWPTVTALSTDLATKYDAVSYSTVAYTNDAAALADKLPASWSATPPATVSADPATRALWVRLVGKTPATTAEETVVLNLTDKVKAIETADRKTARAYLNDQVKPALVATSTSTVTSVTWTTTPVPAVPTALSSKYGSVFYSVTQHADEGAALASPASQWSTTLPTTFNADKAQRFFWARLVATPAYDSVAVNLGDGVANLLAAAPTPAPVGKTEATAYLNQLKNALVATEDSTVNNVTWTTTPLPTESEALTTKYGAPKYSVTKYTDESTALASPESEWSTTLPTTFNTDSALRFFWVRLVATPSSDSAAVELTAGVAGLKAATPAAPVGKTEATAYLNELKAALIAATGSTVDSVTWPTTLPTESEALLAKYGAPTYSTEKFDDEPTALASTTGWTTTLPTSFNADLALRFFHVRLVTNPASNDSAAIDLFDTVKDLQPAAPTPSADKTAATTFLNNDVKSATKVASGSTYSAVVWASPVPALPNTLSTKYSEPRFSRNTYTDEATALASPESEWVARPDSFVPDSAGRFLWVRVVATNSADSAAVPLTRDSGITNLTDTASV